MRSISAIFVLLIAILAVAFAVDNREAVSVGFWPMPLKIVMPLFLVVLGAALTGFLFGASAAWWSGRHARGAARRRARDIGRLEARIAVLEAEQRTQRAAQPAATASLPPP